MAGIGIKGSQNNDNEILYEQPADSNYYAQVANINRRVTTKTATIAISQSLSGEVDLEGFGLLGIIIPTAWTAASISFQSAPTSGGAFQNLYDDAGVQIAIAAAGSTAIGCDVRGPKLAPFRFIKVRSGVAATAVPQGAAVTLTLVLKT